MTTTTVPVRRLLADARQRLQAAGIQDAAFEAELLLRHVLGISRAQLYARLDDDLTPGAIAEYQALLGRRLTREPSAYILGRREFFGLDFAVTPAALIPRPETETLVEAAISWTGNQPVSIADIGTGSGAIAVTLAKSLPRSTVYATDVSSQALNIAAQNAETHGVIRRISLRRGDLLEPLDRRVDVIAANMPYVRADDLPGLEPELRDFEPHVALIAGADGLDLIMRLLQQAPWYLNPGCLVLLEFGIGQSEAIISLAAASFPDANIDLLQDLAGHPRVLRIQRRDWP